MLPDRETLAARMWARAAGLPAEHWADVPERMRDQWRARADDVLSLFTRSGD